jgi:hypothetical protein
MARRLTSYGSWVVDVYCTKSHHSISHTYFVYLSKLNVGKNYCGIRCHVFTWLSKKEYIFHNLSLGDSPCLDKQDLKPVNKMTTRPSICVYRFGVWSFLFFFTTAALIYRRIDIGGLLLTAAVDLQIMH